MFGIEISFLCLVVHIAGRLAVAVEVASPVELRDLAGRDPDLSRARRAARPEGVRAALELVEHRRVGGMPAHAALKHLLVGAAVIVTGGADLHLDPVQVGVGVDDQGPEPIADVQDDVLRMRPVRVAVVDAAHPVGPDGVSNPSWGVPRYGKVAW
jgi:hypothetical protein